MGISRKLRARWMLVSAMLGIICLGGCSVFGNDSSISPASATVTAVVMTATVTTSCTTGTGSPALATTMASSQTMNSVTVGVFRSTYVTIVGTCWHPGDDVQFATIARNTDGSSQVIPLTTAIAPSTFTAPTPVPGNAATKLATKVKADGTFTLTIALTSDLALYDIDNHLTFIAFTGSYQQIAATSIQVSNS